MDSFNVILVGLKRSGKSSFARALGNCLSNKVEPPSEYTPTRSLEKTTVELQNDRQAFVYTGPGSDFFMGTIDESAIIVARKYVLVYDMEAFNDSEESHNVLNHLLDGIRRNAPRGTVVYIVGTHSDLCDKDKSLVKIRGIKSFQVSNVTGDGVKDVLLEIYGGSF